MCARKTGVSMGGRVEYTRKVRPIPCDCFSCFHAGRLNGQLFCGFYQQYNPRRSRCARFEKISGKNLRPKPARKKKR